MDCWRISRSHWLRCAGAFGTTFLFGFEEKDVSFAISFSRLQPQQNAGIVPLRSGCVAALRATHSKIFRDRRTACSKWRITVPPTVEAEGIAGMGIDIVIPLWLTHCDWRSL